jgi:hypothetical protein
VVVTSGAVNVTTDLARITRSVGSIIAPHATETYRSSLYGTISSFPSSFNMTPLIGGRSNSQKTNWSRIPEHSRTNSPSVTFHLNLRSIISPPFFKSLSRQLARHCRPPVQFRT